MASSCGKEEVCNILIIGSHHSRVLRVYNLFREDDSLQGYFDHADVGLHVQLRVFPCVAHFGTYEDQDGINKRYLIGIDCWSTSDGNPITSGDKPGNLQFLIDQQEEGTNSRMFSSISGAVTGAGIEGNEDILKIQTLLETMTSDKVHVDSVRPNPEYLSMRDELAAYKALSAEMKADATSNKTIGPAKFAQFAFTFGESLISNRVDKYREEKRKKEGVILPTTIEKQLPEHTNELAPIPMQQRKIDPLKTRYSCRKCRTVLIGEDDLHNPPHEPAKQNFSYRRQAQRGSESNCQSLFLHDALSWMGDMNETEGKFQCYYCNAKIGIWNWSGAQCSCGSWIVPAIQVPLSKVDVIKPKTSDNELPEGTVISRHISQS